MSLALLLLGFNSIILLFLLGLLMRFIYVVVTVQGASMSPTLNDGDRILVLNWWPKWFLRKGQIVLFRSWYGIPPSPSGQKIRSVSRQLHVKRNVALANETITTSFADIREEMRPRVAAYHDEQGKRTWRIPPRHLFVRGDNHMNSTDSLVTGPLPLQSVYGVVLLKFPCTFYLFPERRKHASAL